MGSRKKLSKLEKQLKELDRQNKKEGYPQVEFVKYHFVDMKGNIRELTLTREEVKGLGYSSTDGSSAYSKIIPPTESDMTLVPYHKTLALLPWDRESARVICDVYHPPEKEGADLKRFEGCARGILSNIEKTMDKVLRKKVEKIYKKKVKKFHAHFAPELEFILLPEKYDQLKLPFDKTLKNDHYYAPITGRVDKAMKQMVRSLNVLQMRKEKYHSEVATHQYEITIGHGNAINMADAIMTARYSIKTIAEMFGMKASFIPKFNSRVNGSGMHCHQNLAVTFSNGKEVNLFYDPFYSDGLSDIGANAIAGLLKYAKEITAFLNSTVVSYKRLVPGAEAPTYIAWDWLNRTGLDRGAAKNTHKLRVEHRSPDPLCNPHLALAAMLSAMLAGIKEGLELPPNERRNLYYDNIGVERLPRNYKKALHFMNGSEMLRTYMGDYIVDQVFNLGMQEWKSYPLMSKLTKKVTKKDIELYF